MTSEDLASIEFENHIETLSLSSSNRDYVRPSVPHEQSLNELVLLKARSHPHIYSDRSSISNRRKVGFNIKDLIKPHSPSSKHTTTKNVTATPGLSNQQSKTEDESMVAKSRARKLLKTNPLGPLTPPNEALQFHWPSSRDVRQHSQSAENRNTDSSQQNEDADLMNSSVGISRSIDGSVVDDFSMSGNNVPAWLRRALRVCSEYVDQHIPYSSTEVVSQVLPPQASDRRSQPTYEFISAFIQQALPNPQFMTITHAVTQARIIEDFPGSPPATPGVHGGDSYFGDQTIFTTAAVVPVYHEAGATCPPASIAAQHHIMAPCKSQMTVIERYIPPTTSAEIADFFNADSNRSYLADRLPELSVNLGSLLLIYPTSKGGRSFTRDYLGPLLDPILREMMILKGMNTRAAELLGVMEAADAMLSFEKMSQKLQQVCSTLNARRNIVSTRSSFHIVHAETTEVVLDKQTWVSWYIEQEQQRLRKDLIEYHKEGGRLPPDGTKFEVTAGMLMREIIESLQKSQATTGEAGIEVGIFVIRRSHALNNPT